MELRAAGRTQWEGHWDSHQADSNSGTTWGLELSGQEGERQRR